MAAGTDRQSRQRRIGFNMTPMIDVVFLLIIFFMLVSNFASAENVPMELPKPFKSQAKQVKLRDRVIINGQISESGATQSVWYRVGPNPPESPRQISARLARAKKAAAAFSGRGMRKTDYTGMILDRDRGPIICRTPRRAVRSRRSS